MIAETIKVVFKGAPRAAPDAGDKHFDVVMRSNNLSAKVKLSQALDGKAAANLTAAMAEAHAAMLDKQTKMTMKTRVATMRSAAILSLPLLAFGLTG
ncbi:hypothetical protein B0T25DRAFT_570377 [Lasiosphaeria hispida]|uniref:Uncharacterized protein n=1 Tax=Lasiosphaeria hispida TaxID=260671 RepID=A0AAJ0HFD5_9PEZI|nr:hypothetical protein B0T25DRAFT_570377 [Lasiosphaeria hispida]